MRCQLIELFLANVIIIKMSRIQIVIEDWLHHSSVVISRGSHRFWCVDEHSSWQLQEISYASCYNTRCCNLGRVSFLYYSVLCYFLKWIRNCPIIFSKVMIVLFIWCWYRSIIGFFGAWKKNSILLWIVSLASWNFIMNQLYFNILLFGFSLTFYLQYLILLCIILLAILVFTVLA